MLSAISTTVIGRDGRGTAKSATAEKACPRGRVVCWAGAGSAPERGKLVRRAMFSIAAAAAVSFSASSASADDASAELFNKTCAGCHAAGGNIVAAGATLFPQDLQRNGVNDVDTIYTLVYGGKNKMPGYGQNCQPRGQCTFGARLSDDEVRGLAEYILEQSKLEWKS